MACPVLQIVQVAAKFMQDVYRALGQGGRQRGAEQCLEHADAVLAGKLAELLHGGVANAAFRAGDGAQEGRIVIVVGQQAEPGAQVLDLGAVKEVAGDLPVYLVGGTARALASLHDAIYSTGRPVNGYTMTADEVAATFKCFRDADKERISLLTRLVPDRLHTIIPGLCAYRRLISIIGASNVVIALGGLREGYLAERLAEAKDNGELA